MMSLLASRPGDDRAFERLYRRHAADVYRYALAVMGSPSDAEDIAQTTFLNAYRSFRGGQRPERPLNWLIAIAHNICRQRFRQAARRPTEVELAGEVAAAQTDEAPRIDDLRRALSQLSFNQRSALVLREIEGRSYAEIAAVLGLSNAAVETLIFRARRALREQLETSLSCREAERAISRRIDGMLDEGGNAALRGHLRACPDCAALERQLRAQRNSLKRLALAPLPGSLVGLFGGGSTLGVGAGAAGGVALKAAVVGASALLATGAGYEAVQHRPPGGHAPATVRHAPQQTPAPPRESPATATSAVLTVRLERDLHSRVSSGSAGRAHGVGRTGHARTKGSPNPGRHLGESNGHATGSASAAPAVPASSGRHVGQGVGRQTSAHARGWAPTAAHRGPPSAAHSVPAKTGHARGRGPKIRATNHEAPPETGGAAAAGNAHARSPEPAGLAKGAPATPAATAPAGDDAGTPVTPGRGSPPAAGDHGASGAHGNGRSGRS